MNKVLADTNVILRYILDDIDDMALIAEHIVDGGAWTTPEVLAEVTYIMSRYYEAPREDVYATLCMISNDIEIKPSLTENAIRHYGETNLDFVDCMMVAYAEAGYRTFSFDKGINKRIADIRRS